MPKITKPKLYDTEIINEFDYPKTRSVVLQYFSKYRACSLKIDMISNSYNCALANDNMGIFSSGKSDQTSQKAIKILECKEYIDSMNKQFKRLRLRLTDDEKIIFNYSILSKHTDEELADRLLNRHETIKEAYVYPPIVSLSTDDVWDILMSNNRKNAWGGDNSQLIELYSDADSGECPFAGYSSKDDQQQSCGQSRFGCWICTVVQEDRSLNGFIRSGHRELIPLAEFRKWLMSIRDVPEYREKKRRDGSVYRTSQNQLGFGPFTWKARQMILRRLLQTQKQMNYELITIDELRAIDRIWDEEQDLSCRVLVDLYYDEMGERLPWDELKHPVFDEETCKKLEIYANEFLVPMDLMKSMIFRTNKTKFFSNTRILRDSLRKAVTQQWLQEVELVNVQEGTRNEDQQSDTL